MRDLVIRHFIEKGREGLYYTIPFEVDKNVNAIEVSYSYPRIVKSDGRLERNIIDFGLIDCDGNFIGWSGSSRSKVMVGPSDSTSGYLMERIGKGTWKILVGAYHVQSAGVEVEYAIRWIEENPRWLFGDLHMHSDASDGAFDVPALARRARRRGLDFISVTDHNNYAENLHLPKVGGLTLIPGVEWTHYKGHMNFFGKARPFEGSFVANSDDEMLRIVRDAKRLGAVVGVNHPKDSLCPYLWKSDDCFDMVEIWNGYMRKSNMNAISWWTEMLMQGRRVPGVGGSDFHRDFGTAAFAHPVTAVWAKSHSENDILEALRSGHSYITCSVNGPNLDVECGEKTFGDVLEAHECVILKANGLKMGYSVELVTDKGSRLFKARHGKCEIMLHDNGCSFAYIMVRNAFGVVKAISNPVYFRMEEQDGTVQ